MIRKLRMAWKIFLSNEYILICSKGYYSSVTREYGTGFFKSSKQLLAKLERQYLDRATQSDSKDKQ